MKRLISFLISVLLTFAVKNLFAYTITHTDYTDNTVVSTTTQNSNENSMVNLLNGNLDYTNLSQTAGITGNQILSSTITYSNIAANAFSNIVSSTSGTSSDQSNSIVSKSITTVGGKVLLIASIFYTGTATATETFSITRGGTSIGGGTTQLSTLNTKNYSITMVVLDTPVAGTYTYKLTHTNTGTINNYTFIAMEVRN